MAGRSRGKTSAGDSVARRVRHFLVEHRLAGARQTLVVAVSGGADSMCLLDVLSRFAPSGRGLRVLHIDHGFRSDSSLDAEVVRATADRLNVPCEVVRVDGPGYARAHRIGLEQAARALRYRELAVAAARHRARAIATGHTADDSVESLLMHLLRGAGTEGLRGISPEEKLEVRRLGPALPNNPSAATVARPLLRVRRTETVAYCRERDLPWRDDPTNDDPSFLRNRVRHHLVPVLRTYNPAVDAALQRTAALVRDDAAWLETLITRRWKMVQRAPGSAEIDLTTWRRQPIAARRRLLRMAQTWVAGDGEGLDFDAAERAMDYIIAGHRGPMWLGGGVSLERTADRLRLHRENGSGEQSRTPGAPTTTLTRS